ncbi:MAG: thioredoxin-dependent thiol peroxidase [Prochlorothrix sp.]|nr:thioredoxin-dependent thiol peroxidase [Prochlorothrix sp.]
MTLNVGDPAPDFSLSDATGQTYTLQALRGKYVVLYFYPRDNTPGCTKEACGFRDRQAQFDTLGAIVLGVSTDNAKSHTKFITKHNLTFPLLCDPDGKVASLYESYGLKKFMGREFVGVFRRTVIIDPEGNLAKIYPKVKPEPHPEEVLQDLKAFGHLD